MGGEFRAGVVNADLANVPQRALEFYNKALEPGQAGKNKAAIEKLRQAISEHSGFMLAFNELGVQYLRLSELDKANESLLGALKIAPEAFTPPLNHGNRPDYASEFEAYLRLAPTAKDADQVRQVIRQLKGSNRRPATAQPKTNDLLVFDMLANVGKLIPTLVSRETANTNLTPNRESSTTNHPRICMEIHKA